MCATCGCSDIDGVTVTDPEGLVFYAAGAQAQLPDGHPHENDAHHHEHPHGEQHDHSHGHSRVGSHQHRPAEVLPPHGHPVGAAQDRLIVLEQQVLAKNDELADRNREWLRLRGTVAVNLMSSPGSGKTTLLERTIRELSGRVDISVIEGDQATQLDAKRIRATGCEVVQVNTGAGCHLDADMISRALTALDPATDSVVIIENVGNLVCPALFDLGERARVVVMSVTEGHDKPLKYPHMFRTADVVLLNKTDLLPYVDFDVAAFTTAVRMVRPNTMIIDVSAATGAGMDMWYSWLGEHGAAQNHKFRDSAISGTDESPENGSSSAMATAVRPT